MVSAGLQDKYVRRVPFVLDALETPIFEGKYHFASINTNRCPITSYDLFWGHEPYTKTCVNLNPQTGDLKYAGKFCEENGFKIRMNSVNGYFAFTESFSVRLLVDCQPHLQTFGFEPKYSIILPVKTQLYNKIIFNAKQLVFSEDTVNCPVEFIKLL